MFGRVFKDKHTTKEFEKFLAKTDPDTLDLVLGDIIDKRLHSSDNLDVSKQEAIQDASFAGYFKSMQAIYRNYQLAKENMEEVSGVNVGNGVIPSHPVRPIRNCLELYSMITTDDNYYYPIEWSGKDLRTAFAGVSSHRLGFTEIELQMVKKFEETYFTGTRCVNDNSYYCLNLVERSDGTNAIIPHKLPALSKGTCDQYRSAVDSDTCIMVAPDPNERILGYDLTTLLHRQFNLLLDLRPTDAPNLDCMPVLYAYYLQGYINAFNKYLLNPSYTIDRCRYYLLSFPFDINSYIPNITIKKLL